MNVARQLQTPSMVAAWLAQAQTHPWTTLGLGVSALATLWLLGLSVARIASGQAEVPLQLAMLGGFAGFATTALG